MGGTCDGCSKRVASGDAVMQCKSCNWYLCTSCHPQEQNERSFFWGSVSALADKAAQEFKDLQEVAENAETMGPLAACVAPPVKKHSGPEDDEEIRVVTEETSGLESTAAVLRTPVSTAQPKSSMADAGNKATPPKTEAPKEEAGVDLLGLETEEPKKVDKVDEVSMLAGLTIGEKDPFDLL